MSRREARSLAFQWGQPILQRWTSVRPHTAIFARGLISRAPLEFIPGPSRVHPRSLPGPSRARHDSVRPSIFCDPTLRVSRRHLAQFRGCPSGYGADPGAGNSGGNAGWRNHGWRYQGGQSDWASGSQWQYLWWPRSGHGRRQRTWRADLPLGAKCGRRAIGGFGQSARRQQPGWIGRRELGFGSAEL